VSKASFTLMLSISFILLCNWQLFLKVNNFYDMTSEFYNITELSPFRSFIQVLFNRSERVSLSSDDLKLARNYGIEIQPDSPYPLVKNWIYRDKIPFSDQLNTNKKPNIIVFFMEGVSARLIDAYNSSFKGLTPNISGFSSNSHTMIVTNYFNHTAATYHGLHGQLCSLWPIKGGRDFNDRLHGPMQPKYFSLVNYLSQLGYKTHFFYTQHKDRNFLDELGRVIGFEDIAAGEDLSRRYLSNSSFVEENAISDQQLFKALINFVHVHQEQPMQPFFLSIYNFDTHAFIDDIEDGKKFRKGDNVVLNSIHNLDSAFGLFWKEFLTSKLADNTLVILTTDHAHYPEKRYVDVIAPHDPAYSAFFFDRIPLIIYDPTRSHPVKFDAGYRTSIDFTPSLIHYLGFPNVSNPFIGNSIFDNTNKERPHIAFSSIDEDFYWADEKGIHNLVPFSKNTSEIVKIEKIVRYLKMLDNDNRIWTSSLPVQK
jgi:lipoteichoic acid synthase